MALSASRAVLSKVRLTTLIGKHGNKNFYKGRGAKKFGKPDKWGNFQFNAKQANRHSLQVPPLLNEFPVSWREYGRETGMYGCLLWFGWFAGCGWWRCVVNPLSLN